MGCQHKYMHISRNFQVLESEEGLVQVKSNVSVGNAREFYKDPRLSRKRQDRWVHLDRRQCAQQRLASWQSLKPPFPSEASGQKLSLLHESAS